MSKYILEIERKEFYNRRNTEMENMEPVYVSNEKRSYKRWEDLAGDFFQPRIERDFCYGDNFIDLQRTITRVEEDEGGYTIFILDKWDTFDEDVHFVYTVELKDKEAVTIEGTAALTEWLKQETGEETWIYWNDDTAGHLGWIKSKDTDKEYGSVTRKVLFRDTEYLKHCREKQEAFRRTKVVAPGDWVEPEEPEKKDELPF